jgi:hypothetical protein
MDRMKAIELADFAFRLAVLGVWVFGGLVVAVWPA